MKVKQIVGEAGQGGPSNQGAKGFGNPDTKYTVAPDNGAPTPAGQEKMITLVPVGSPVGNGTQPVQGQITVQANAVDLTDPNNPVIDPKALQGNQQPQTQQPNALANKTVSVGLDEEPNEDMIAKNTTYPVSLQTGKPIALVNGNNPARGQPIELTRSGEEVTPEFIAKNNSNPSNAIWELVYLNVNGKKYPAASYNSGTQIRVGKQTMQSMMASKSVAQATPDATTDVPLTSSREESGISRIAHLAGIR